MRFASIDADHCAGVWHLVEDHLRRACARGVGDISPETLRAECIGGDARLIVALDDDAIHASGVARFCLQANGSIACELVACGGGSLQGWRHIIPDIEAWARFHGASTIRACGRPGWARIFRGYRRRPLVSLIKDL